MEEKTTIKDRMKIKVDNAFQVFTPEERKNLCYIVDAADGFVIGTFEKQDLGKVVDHFKDLYRKFTFGLTGDVFVYEKIKKPQEWDGK